jgi:hypothetical protein
MKLNVERRRLARPGVLFTNVPGWSSASALRLNCRYNFGFSR